MDEERKYIELGKRVRDARVSKQLTQIQLANLCGYSSKAAICKIESGERKFPLDKLETIANVLGIDIDYLLYGIGEKPTVIETVHPSARGKKAVLMSWINEMSDKDVDKLISVIEMFFKKEE